MISARDENARTLREMLGLGMAEADRVLDGHVAITASSDPEAQQAAGFVHQLLSRTFSKVGSADAVDVPVAEVVVGETQPRTGATPIFLWTNAGDVGVALDAPTSPHARGPIHPIFLLVGACHVAALVLRLVTRRSRGSTRVLLRPADLLGPDSEVINEPINLGRVHLAGAGAIGNAFAFALGLFDVAGHLCVVDDDLVSAANLNRCLLFTVADVGLPKALRLAMHLRQRCSRLVVDAAVCRLQDHPEKAQGPHWLQRLVVGVDSRRARRSIQDEWPREIYDASTTGIEEVVLNFHEAGAPTWCLGCAYPEDTMENAHEVHVAEMLGVSVVDVKTERISPDAARRIMVRHGHLAEPELAGLAYDTLFKQLCGAGQLGVAAERQVLAPLAFVPALAGAYLALELVRRASRSQVVSPFAHWRLSPWDAPQVAARRTWPAKRDCVCCSDSSVQRAVRRIWGVDAEGEEDG